MQGALIEGLNWVFYAGFNFELCFGTHASEFAILAASGFGKGFKNDRKEKSTEAQIQSKMSTRRAPTKNQSKNRIQHQKRPRDTKIELKTAFPTQLHYKSFFACVHTVDGKLDVLTGYFFFIKIRTS